MQSKCSGITTEITHEIPLVDLHIAHIFHWISVTGRGYGRYVDSSWLVALEFVVSSMHMYNWMQHNISIFTHLTLRMWSNMRQIIKFEVCNLRYRQFQSFCIIQHFKSSKTYAAAQVTTLYSIKSVCTSSISNREYLTNTVLQHFKD